jgi:ubiquinone/menaquinone biosynthesis C-methylase UbiE
MSELNTQVRQFWEKAPCGTDLAVLEEIPHHSREWFETVEENRYTLEPFIHSAAQFTRHSGKMLLEVGVGAGTDHLQWARAGARCHGVDLTEAAISTTKDRLACYGLSSNLQRIDAETLPFPDSTFDLVYSWGVIHHSEKPQQIVREIHRVLKPGGIFIGMMYSTVSLVSLRFWLKYALFAGRPFRSVANVLWNHMESIGTKAYRQRDIRDMFQMFSQIRTEKVVTPYDTRRLPPFLAQIVPPALGWFMTIRATK